MFIQQLPTGAGDEVRLAYASFAATALLVRPLATEGRLNPGYVQEIANLIVEQYGQGDSDGAVWVRQAFGGDIAGIKQPG